MGFVIRPVRGGQPRPAQPVRAARVLALVDFAHNEAGLAGLLDVCDRLVARPRGRVRLGLGTASDRTDEILHRMGLLAGSRVDDLVIAEKPHYLRGRTWRQ